MTLEPQAAWSLCPASQRSQVPGVSDKYGAIQKNTRGYCGFLISTARSTLLGNRKMSRDYRNEDLIRAYNVL